jgi:hypothetical protein
VLSQAIAGDGPTVFRHAEKLGLGRANNSESVDGGRSSYMNVRGLS